MIKRNKGTKYGRLYTKEQIDELSSLNPNTGLGKGGSDNYDIFMHKGGKYCKHLFKRNIFFRKRDSSGRYETRSKTQDMENDNRVGAVPGVYPRKGSEAVRPIDTPKRGAAS